MGARFGRRQCRRSRHVLTSAAATFTRWSGRPYTTAAVYRWAKVGRLRVEKHDGTTFVRIADLRRLADELADELADYLATKHPDAAAFSLPERHQAEMLRADLKAAGLVTADAGGGLAQFHSLRHTTATWLVAEGVPMKVVQLIMRHQTFALTADRYSHATLKQMADALDALPDLNAATGTDDLPETCPGRCRRVPPDAALRYDAPGWGGRAVECAGLENR